MFEISIADLIALLTALAVFLKVFFPQLWPSQTEKAEISARHSTIAQEYQEMLKNEIAERKLLEEEVDRLKKEIVDHKKMLEEQTATIKDLKRGINRLVKQFESLDIVPVWKPTPENNNV